MIDRYVTITEVSHFYLFQARFFSRIVIQRIQDGVEKQLREEQAGFRKGRSTTEQLFTLRNIIEQCTEWNSTLLIILILRKQLIPFIEKAFGEIEMLWHPRQTGQDSEATI